MQSRARRSYRAVVMPTDALLTLGILKLTSLIVTEYEGRLQGLRISLGGNKAWSEGDWVDVLQMRGS